MRNHRWNAQLRRLPPCPECSTPRSCACRNEQGNVRAPHRSRERVVAGELFVVRADDARVARKLRAIQELVAAINGES